VAKEPRTLGIAVGDLLSTLVMKEQIDRSHYALRHWIAAVIDRQFPPGTEKAEEAASAIRKATRLFLRPSKKTLHQKLMAAEDAVMALPPVPRRRKPRAKRSEK
jgi:hypothetical protein